MKRFVKIIALCLISALLFTGCGSNNYSSTVAATYGDKTVYLDEANFWLRYFQQTYESYYGTYFSYYGITDMWSQSSGNRTQTYAESAREQVMAEYLQAFILLDHAADYDITLTEEDQKKIEEAADSIMASTSFLELAKESDLTKEKLIDWIGTRSQALKVYEGVKAQAPNVSVSDEDADSFSVNYFLVYSSTSLKESDFAKLAGNEDSTDETAIEGEALAKRLEDCLKNGVEYDKIKEAFTSLTANSAAYRYADTNNSSILYSKAKEMKEGEVQIIEASGNYYVMQMKDLHDEHETAHAREDLEDEQRVDYFNEVLAEWKKAAKEFSVKSSFKNLKMSSAS
ncbi:MAG: hypothetical protein II882_02295 [Lachnospiraceae bacterium]|nr:hypothetical protein [Lachnospiraceae bacterium]